ncbi:MAG: PQQ-binding-like beta-propeller repeat protein [Acidobacteriota bacterium]
MSRVPPPTSTTSPPLRLWPGLIAVAIQWAGRFVVPQFFPQALAAGVLGGLALGLVIALWWLLFSRAPAAERVGAFGLTVAAVAATFQGIHPSIAKGMMGMMYWIYVIPVVSLAFVAWAVASRRLRAGGASTGIRLAVLGLFMVLACGSLAVLKTEGMTSDADSEFAWRWSPDRAQALADEGDIAPAGAGNVGDLGARWSGFRGDGRDGVVRGTGFRTDWDTSPPVELWRREVGPGWSSFAVAGDVFYTQEQRGDDEVVSCHRLDTGEPVWRHRDAAKFWESNAGAGPRSTPTVADGRVYTFGATGVLNALDAADGSRIWTRDVATDAGREVPYFGFSSSPLLVDDLVLVAAEGQLVAYDRASGEPRWFGEDGKYGYSSPHALTLGGVRQIVLMNGIGATAVSPDDGRPLWSHPLPSNSARIVQPAQLGGGEFLFSDGEGKGLRRVAVAASAEGWGTEERWESIRLKPYLSDFVVHGGHAYGFDGSLMASIDVETGERNWKGGRYGSGQLLLLADQDLLLVVSEKGRLILVSAKPDGFEAVAEHPAIDGKTWNHPALVDDILLVRNGEEMAAFRLPS